MYNVEEKNCVAATENYKKGIQVKSLVTDETHQIIRKLNDIGIEKLVCIIHDSRGMKRVF